MNDINTPQRNDDIRSLLLDSLRGIPFAVEWGTGRFVHIGPQIETMLGYSPADWVSIADWSDSIHPDDKEWAVRYCISESEEGKDHEFEYRIIKKNGDIVWVRDVVNVVKETSGNINYLVGFISDITNHKIAQNQIINDKNEYQKLSITDYLTKLYNRRKFDSSLIEQWNTAIRTPTTLSLLIIDIDFFKNYNDLYGHTKGDEALILVANTLLYTFEKAQGIVCRIGGEEFAILLTNTSLDTAKQLATELFESLAALEIHHGSSCVGNYLTLSVGIGETTPSPAFNSQQFHTFVDHLLYSAKNNGRNRIETGRFD